MLTVWLRTCRVEVRCAPGTSPFAGRRGEPAGAGPHVPSFYPFWHEWIVPHVFARPHAAMAGLISQHRDGGYLADAMTAIGLKTVRGSTSRGGAAAAMQILKECGSWDVGITPDGPRGPRRKLKPGVVFLASRTGRPIVPTAVACQRSWRPSASWTDLLLPKPFTKIVFCGGEAVTVPPGLGKRDLDRWCRYVESLIAAQERRAGVLANGGEDPGAGAVPPPGRCRVRRHPPRRLTGRRRGSPPGVGRGKGSRTLRSLNKTVPNATAARGSR